MRNRLTIVAAPVAALVLLGTLFLMVPSLWRDRLSLPGRVLMVREAFSMTPRFTSDSSAAIVASAEAEGARYPRPVGESVDSRGRHASSIVGRHCVTIGSASAAVSGEIQSGGWSSSLGGYRGTWMAGGGKVWWRPADFRRGADGADSATMIVRALRIDRALRSGAETNSVSNSVSLSPVSRHGDTLMFTLKAAHFTGAFPSGVRVPTPGRWLFIATMTENWGCFIYTV